MTDDRHILRALARHIRKQETLGCFDQDDPYEEERAEQLIEWLADNIDTLNVPPKDNESPHWASGPLP